MVYYIVSHEIGTKMMKIYFLSHSLVSARKQAKQLKEVNKMLNVKVVKLM